MKQYIDKSAVLAEIEKLQDSTMDEDGNFYSAKAQAEYDVLCVLEEYLDTLEVKEVDFEKIWKEYFKYRGDVATVNVKNLAKHFFELGLKARKGE